MFLSVLHIPQDSDVSDFEFADNALSDAEKAPVVDGTFLDDEDYRNEEEEGSAIDPEGSGTTEEPSFTTSAPIFPTTGDDRPDDNREVPGNVPLTCYHRQVHVNNIFQGSKIMVVNLNLDQDLQIMIYFAMCLVSKSPLVYHHSHILPCNA